MDYQDHVKRDIRSAAILTGSYVAGTVLEDCYKYNEMVLLVNFTKGSLTTLEVKIEGSTDGTNYYQETASSVTTGTSTETLKEHAFGATGKYRIIIPVKDRYIKVSAKGTGTATDSSLEISAILRN